MAVPPSGIWPSAGRASRHALDSEADLRRVALEFLAERHRDGVHQVRAAGLDDVGELVGLALERARRGRRAREAARRRPLSSAARWTADGKTSFDDWPMFTWSFGWTSSPARVAITSFAFMFELVPEPVWKTSIGNWSSSSPAAIRSPASAMRCAMSASRRPRSAFARAAAALIRPSQRATGGGIGSPGDREVLDRLRGLCAPELPVLGGAALRAGIGGREGSTVSDTVFCQAELVPISCQSLHSRRACVRRLGSDRAELTCPQRST